MVQAGTPRRVGDAVAGLLLFTGESMTPLVGATWLRGIEIAYFEKSAMMA